MSTLPRFVAVVVAIVVVVVSVSILLRLVGSGKTWKGGLGRSSEGPLPETGATLSIRSVQ